MAMSSRPEHREDNDADRVIAIVEALVEELHPGRRSKPVLQDSSLQRDLGIGSLAVAELVLRLEREFKVHLPEDLITRAETPRDLINELKIAGHQLAHEPNLRSAQIAEPALDTPVAAATLTEALDWHVEHHPQRTHVMLSDGFSETESIAYAELAQSARQVGSGLRLLGLMPGDRVAIMLPTGPHFFHAFLGALYAGGVPVPMYPPMRMSQLEDHLRRQAGILANCAATVLIVLPEWKAMASLLSGQVTHLRSVTTIDSLTRQDIGQLPTKQRRNDLAMLQYTSGSTGDPKGVMLSHENLLTNIRALGQAISVTSQDRFVSWLPLYHDMGLIGAWLGSLYFAVPLVVMSPLKFIVRPESWLWAIHRNRGTLSAAPNFAFEFCLNKIDDRLLDGLDLSSLRMVANGAERVSADTIARFAERFSRYGFQASAMTPVYGLAENAVGLAFPPMGRGPKIDLIHRDALARRGEAKPATRNDVDVTAIVACGKPIEGHEIRVVDHTGRELGERQEGILEFRGPSSTQGYFHDDDKTRDLFDGEWLNSGDLAYIAEGDVYITGRVKDIIIKGGRNIYPGELEDAVGMIEGVRKGCVAVFASTESISAPEKLVVLAETRLTDPDKCAMLKSRIGETANDVLGMPADDIVIAPPRTVPKTSSGKLRRSAARRLYESQQLSKPSHAIWLQVLRLGLAGVRPRLRRWWRTLLDLLYAGWWWFILISIGSMTWLSILVLPRRPRRWRVMRSMSRLALRLMGINVSLHGHPPPPSQSGIIVANHSSYIDGLVLSAVVPGEPIFVAKRELENQLIAGLFLKRLSTFFAERADRRTGIAQTEELTRLVHRGERLVFFPEGTLTRMPGLLSFQLGAFSVASRTGVGIVPITLRGTRSILRPTQWYPRRGAVSVVINDTIMPAGDDFAAAVRLRGDTRRVMLEHCGEPSLSDEDT